MLFMAKTNENKIVTDVIIVSNYNNDFDGYIPCNYWIGIGMHLDATKPDELFKTEVRDERDKLLVELDEVVLNPLRFASFTDEQKAELATYRQALLDVPQQSGFPVEVAWPVRPEFI